MKKFIIIILVLIAGNSKSQTFGPDITVFDSITYDVSKIFLDVAYNGWIYEGFNYYDYPMKGYRVLLSTNQGASWQTLIDFAVPGASGWYPQMTDMLVAGNDSSNLRVFLSLNGYGNGGPQSLGAITAFNGITGADIGNPVTLGDFMTYGIVDVALSSDYSHPLSTSSPYSVAAVYSVSNNSGLDSISYYFSNDGGLNFSGPYKVDADTAGNYSDVDISFGSYQNPSVGKFGIAFMKGNNLGVAFSDPGSPTTFSGYNLVDTANAYTSGQCTNPVISMQSAGYMNTSSDYTTVIMAAVNNLTNSSEDLVSFYLYDTQNGGNWNFAVVDSSSHFTNSPAIDFDSLNANFIATYFDTTNKELPLILQNINSTENWIRTTSDYPDTLKFYEPTPRVSVNHSLNTIACSWKQLSDSSILPGQHQSIKFDFMTLPVRVQEIKSTEYEFNVFPNPSTGEIHLNTNQEIKKVQITLMNSIGEVVYSSSATLQPGNDISISGLSKGIYTLQICDGIKMRIRKVIVL